MKLLLIDQSIDFSAMIEDLARDPYRPSLPMKFSNSPQKRIRKHKKVRIPLFSTGKRFRHEVA